MGVVHEDRFLVFLRSAYSNSDRPDVVERDLIACSSLAEARRIRSQFQSPMHECVIRYVGPTGGGD